MNVQHITAPSGARTRSVTALIAALAFLIFYLLVSPVAGAIAPLPLPDAPTDEVVAYFTEHGTASVVTGGLQLLSVAGLAVFLWAIRCHGPQTRARDLCMSSGWIAIAAMGLSGAIAIGLPLVVSVLSPGGVEVARQASFVAGGVVHVVALGAAALTIGLWRSWSRPVRVTAWIAAVPALLSVTSVFWYYASILLPAGRLLTMTAFIVAGVSILRGRSLPSQTSALG